MTVKPFRDLREAVQKNETNPKHDPTVPHVAGDDKSTENQSDIMKTHEKALKHVRQFMKHPVAGDHQFNGSREAVGVKEDVDENLDESPFSGKSKVIDKMDFPTKGVKDMSKDKNKKKKKSKNEDAIIDTLLRIVETQETEEIIFDDGYTVEVDPETAIAVTQVYESLNTNNQEKFSDNLIQSEVAFQKMVEFSLEQQAG
jgi:hypothetical protein